MNIVAVSDHVFHRFPFDLLSQVSTPLLFFSILCPLASCRTRALLMYLTVQFPTHPCSFPLQNLVLLTALAPQFRQNGTFVPNNSNAGGSAVCIHKNLLPEGAIVTHVVTCLGRDDIVNIQSGARNLVIVNVHFEPDLT